MTGAFASGFFLMGVALIFGATGNLNFMNVAEMFKAGIGEGQLTLSYVGIIFVLSSLLFKIGSVPFHMWAPDVYQAGPTAMVAVLATAGKVSVFSALGILFVKLGLYNYELIKDYVYWIGVLSVVIGSLGASAQRSLRRVLAYSGIVNAGYVILALSLGAATMGAVIVNLLIYSLTFIALLAVIERVLTKSGADSHGDIKISELGNYFNKSNPFWSALFVMLIFSTAGLPPLPGFFGKYLLLKEVWTLGGYNHVFFILLGTLLGLMYYLNTVVMTVLKDSQAGASLTSPTTTELNRTKFAASFVAIAATVISLWAMSGLSRLPAWVSSVEMFAR
jgi:NADH-quinone oxidoreductase subunit N